MQPKGLIIVHTGPGKGKTTAALGAALRAAGHGMRVLILQFMKGRGDTGEIKALKTSGLPIEIRQFGRRIFFHSRACEPIDIYKANLGLQAFADALRAESHDMIVLDEINMAVDFGLIDFKELQDLIRQKPPHLHLILTGRNARPELIEMADMVTEMRELKHHYQRGVQAKKGIEY